MLRLVLNLDLSSEVQGRLQDAVEMENRDEVARIIADVFKGPGEIEVTTSIKRKGKLRPGTTRMPLFGDTPGVTSVTITRNPRNS